MIQKLILTGALAWIVPGAGHLLLRQWWQGILLLLGTLLLLFVGWQSGGLYYPGSPADFGIMYWLHQFSGAGNGIFLFLNVLFKQSFQSPAATKAFSSPIFEYAGRCLALAGLLNYLAVINVFDNYLRRKKF